MFMDSAALKELLSSSDENARVNAAARLRFLPRDEAQELFAVALSDSAVRVRKAAEESFKIGISSKDLPLLFQWLGNHENANLRTAAFEMLRDCRDILLSGIVAKSRSKDSEIRKFCADLLCGVTDAKGVEALKNLLEDRDLNVRVAAAESLAATGLPDAKDAILKRLKVLQDPYEIFSFMEALRFLGEKGLKLPVGKWLNRFVQNAVLRKAVIHYLGSSRNASAVSCLADIFNQYPEDILDVARSLVRLKSTLKSFPAGKELARKFKLKKNVAEILLEKAKDMKREEILDIMNFAILTSNARHLLSLALSPGFTFEDQSIVAEFFATAGPSALQWAEERTDMLSPVVAAAAALSMGMMKSPTVRKKLVNELKHILTSHSVADYLLTAYLQAGKIAPSPEIAELLCKKCSSLSEEAMEAAAEYFRSMGKKLRYSPRLFKRLKEICTGRCAVFLAYFVEGGPPEKVREALEIFLKHDDPAIRAKAVEVLGPWMEEYPDSLAPFFNDENEDVRISAISSISRWKGDQARRYLACALRDESEMVRARAVDTAAMMKKLKLKEKMNILKVALSDPSPYVAISAIATIKHITQSREEACLSLIEALYHPVEDVVVEAAREMSSCLEHPKVREALKEAAQRNERVRAIVDNLL